jgi:MFS family permease
MDQQGSARDLARWGPGRLRAVFARPGYRRLWLARTASQWGDVFATVALSLLVFDLTGSALGVSAVVAVEIIPVLLFAPFAGTLVDRLPRVQVMVAADLLRAVLATALIFTSGNVAAVYVIAFALSIGTVLFKPAANSTLPTLVTDRELVAANSGIWTAAVLSQIALAPLAGVLYAALGPGPAFGINAVSFLTSAAALAGLRLPTATGSTRQPGFFTDAAAGIRLLAGDRLLRALGAGQVLAALSAGATSALLVVLASEHLQLPPSGFGLLLGARGSARCSGRSCSPAWSPIRDGRRSRSAPTSCAGSSTLSWRRSPRCPSPWALAAYGLGTSSGAVTFNSLLQAHTPAEARGRIFASFDVLWQLGRLVSLLLGGLLAIAIGIQAVYYLGGVLLLLAAMVGWHAHVRPR